MAEGLLTRLLRFALSETRVDRVYAFDTHGTLVEHAILDKENSSTPEISEYMSGLIQRANETGQLILSNNTFIDPSQAPNTNTSIQNLRIYVVLPVQGYGVLFLDQPIGSGIVPRPTIDKLFALCQRAARAATPEALTDAEMREFYATS
jgi:hypothetical protein